MNLFNGANEANNFYVYSNIRLILKGNLKLWNIGITRRNGRRVRVTSARPRTKGMGRRGFDPSMRCYQCGDRGHFSRDCPDSKYGYKRPPSPRRGGGGRYYPEGRDRGDRFDEGRRFEDRRY